MAKVLLVEDDVAIRALLESKVKLAGHEVRTAKHGQDALAVLEDFSPDVVVSDVTMPVMDGMALLARLRDLPETRHVPVILLTALAQPQDIMQAEQLGATDYILKPFDPDVLVERLQAVLVGE